MGFLLSQDYPDFEIISLSNPYPSSLFLYTMSEEERFMAIIDSNLNVQWTGIDINPYWKKFGEKNKVPILNLSLIHI